jgi:dihydroorotate dehydrogenase (fumarate)
MGIPLKNPIIVAASTISGMVDRIKMCEDVGAGALVIRSLFEEQIELDRQHLDDFLAVGSESFAEATSFFPEVKYNGAEEHLMWIEKSRQVVEMPLIASLNAVSPGGWVTYAKQLEETGVDGLELNIYAVATDLHKTATAIEQELYEIVESVLAEVKIPVSVKLSPFYTSIVNVASELDKRKVAGLVLFNRFLQPTIDIDTESLHSEMNYSLPQELKLPLRWTALLHGRIKTDISITTGVHTGRDVVRCLLGGATTIQTASALLKHGLPYISTMLRDVEAWMAEKGYDSIDEFRGKVSQRNIEDPFGFERAQYVKLILSQI